jgi:hypothetical protein
MHRNAMISPGTQEPSRFRSTTGAQRFGEMERGATILHGTQEPRRSELRTEHRRITEAEGTQRFSPIRYHQPRTQRFLPNIEEQLEKERQNIVFNGGSVRVLPGVDRQIDITNLK